MAGLELVRQRAARGGIDDVEEHGGRDGRDDDRDERRGGRLEVPKVGGLGWEEV